MEYIDGSKPKKKIEIRKLQALTGQHSLTLVFPRQFALQLGIENGDFLKCYVDDCRLIVEKLHSSYQAGQIV